MGTSKLNNESLHMQKKTNAALVLFFLGNIFI